MAPKVLFVLTSHDKMGDTGKPTGWYLVSSSLPYLLTHQNQNKLTTHPPTLSPNSPTPTKSSLPTSQSQWPPQPAVRHLSTPPQSRPLKTTLSPFPSSKKTNHYGRTPSNSPRSSATQGNTRPFSSLVDMVVCSSLLPFPFPFPFPLYLTAIAQQRNKSKRTNTDIN